VSWSDTLRLAARSVLRRPGRAALTVIAVALAAALFTAMLIMAATAQTRVLDQLTKGGPLAGIQVSAAAALPTQLGSDNPTPGPPRPIDRAALGRISRLADVDTVLPIVTSQSVITWPGHSLVSGQRGGPDGSRSTVFDQLVGVDLTHVVDLPITTLAGRLPRPGSTDEVAVTPVLLARFGITQSHLTRAIGTTIVLGSPRGELAPDGTPVFRARWTKATIVGVVAQQAGSGSVLTSLGLALADHDWTAGGDPRVDGDLPTSQYAGLFVIARTLDDVPQVRASIATIGYTTSAPENLIATVQRYVHVMEIVLGGIGGIALTIASLGIANALLAAVRERRREIGILKAVGARDRDILRTFLTEAAVMGAVGGVVGTVLGFVLSRLVAQVVNGYLTGQGLATVHVTVPALLGVASVAGSILLALAAGVLPARRAARLPAREAVEL
jgi:hypothetical protein